MENAQRLTLPNRELIPLILRKMSESGKPATLWLRGNSMRPFLEDGRDRALLVLVTDSSTLNIGDPVLAEIEPLHYVLHRIVAIEADGAVTLLGDGNLTPEHCHLNDIRAIAKGFYRKGRNTIDSTTGRKWKVYSKLWMALRPIRRYLLAIWRRIIRLL